MDNITGYNFKELNQFKKIYCLVSGGIDSTYLYEMCRQECDNSKLYPVNSYNPFEISNTLINIKNNDSKFIQIIPDEEFNYTEILHESFTHVPEAIQARINGKYHKKIFGCCADIKHNSFKKNKLFQEENIVIISGIKAGDGEIRCRFLGQLRNGRQTIGTSNIPNNYYLLTEGKERPTFYHKHIYGPVYCYPYRDFTKRELPNEILYELHKKYPKLTHSGCSYCPVLIVFRDRIVNRNIDSNTMIRLNRSIDYCKKNNINIDLPEKITNRKKNFSNSFKDNQKSMF